MTTLTKTDTIKTITTHYIDGVTQYASIAQSSNRQLQLRLER